MRSETMERGLSFTLNGKKVEMEAPPGLRLSQALREALGSRDVKVGCNAGDCGACTALVNGEAVCACLMPARQAMGAKVETAAGLAKTDPDGARLVKSFQKTGAIQCGICTPGMIVSAVVLLRRGGEPKEEAVKDALGGVLCRCTGYRKIIGAVMDAWRKSPAPGTEMGKGWIGEPAMKLDGAEKATGEERFGDDVAPPGSLEIKIIRSPFAAARFEIGDVESFIANHEGVEAVLTARDVPGVNRFGIIPGHIDQPVFAETAARFKGEAVAAVVGAPGAIQRLDPEEFPVKWEETRSLRSMEEATAEGAPLIHPDRPGNILCSGRVRRGNAAEALKKASAVVEIRAETGFLEHAYIEPEAGYAVCKDGKLEVHACTQSAGIDLDGLVAVLGMRRESLRIIPTAVGGGFGSKLDMSVQPYLAIAALKTGKPVRLAYSRIESMQSSTKRHPSEITLKVGADDRGKICGLEFRGRFNTGAYASWGPTVADRVPIHASGPYQVESYFAEATAIYTNGPPSGAFRGFGVPQAAIAQETAYDELAEKLGIDPLEFRIANALENGVPTVCGQSFEGGVGIKACLERLRPEWKRAGEEARKFNEGMKSGTLKRGVGVAAGWYGCGNTSIANPSTIKAGLRPDGKVILHQGAIDIGQGSNTVIAQIFATALGAPLGAVALVGADTEITPDAGKTSASRQTFVSGNAARLAGEALRARLLELCNASKSASMEFREGAVVIADSRQSHEISLDRLGRDSEGYVIQVAESYNPPTRPLDENGQGEPYAQFGYAAHLAEVEVDMALGVVRPTRVVAAHDVGKAINPMLVEGQIHGGVAQGLGMALMEEFIPERGENLHDYLIPTFGDVPPVECVIVEEADPNGPFGAKGLGEHALIPTAPAVLNAIYSACGARVRRIPAAPSAMLEAMERARHGGR